MLVASYITNILLNTLIISVCYFLYLQRQARMTTCCFMQSLHCVMLLYGIGRHLVFHRLKPSVCTWWILLLKGLGKTDETHFLFHHLIILVLSSNYHWCCINGRRLLHKTHSQMRSRMILDGSFGAIRDYSLSAV